MIKEKEVTQSETPQGSHGDVENLLKTASHQQKYLEDAASPIATEMYELLIEPQLSRQGYYYYGFLSAVVILRIIAMGLESCDGPNQYFSHNEDLATYPTLLTQPQYFQLYIVCMSFLIFDAFLKTLLLALITLEEENYVLFFKMQKDKLWLQLLVADYIGLIPFFITAGYIEPNHIDPLGWQRAVLAMFEMSITFRIYRFVRYISAVRVVTTAISNSIEHLILPLFFFFVFNITAAVFFYFAEPCYQVDSCPWKDLFEATFFSIVTMSTTGYGNQIPSYELGRFAAVLVMLFGAIFLSMPLAILGNEYDKAWRMIVEEKRVKAEELANETAAVVAAAKSRNDASENRGTGLVVGSDEKGHDPAKDGNSEVDGGEISTHPAAVLYYHLLDVLQGIHDQFDKGGKGMGLRVGVVIGLCDLKEGLKNFVVKLTALKEKYVSIVENGVVRKNSHSDVAASANATPGQGRRLSMFDHGVDIHTQLPGKGNKVHPMAIEEDDDSDTESDLDDVVEEVGIARPAWAGEEEGSSAGKKKKVKITDLPVVPVAGANLSEGVGWGSIEERSLSSLFSSSDEEEEEDNTKDSKGADAKSLGIVVKSPPPSSSSPNNLQPISFPARNRVPFHSPLPSAASNSNVDEDDSKADEQDSDADSNKDDIHNRPALLTRSVGEKGAKGTFSRLTRYRSQTFLFNKRLDAVSSNPHTLRSRLWTFLELPHTSKGGRVFQVTLICLLLLSILILYTQTLPQYTEYGEHTEICQMVVQIYCEDKHDAALDAGCYVYGSGSGVNNNMTPLRFFCKEPDCYGQGNNFGSYRPNAPPDDLSSLFTCLDSSNPPFQSATQLALKYITPSFFPSRNHMHRSNAICGRVECTDNSAVYTDVSTFWTWGEFIVNSIFTIEIFLRMAVSENIYLYLYDMVNLVDWIAILPFYIDLVRWGGSGTIDFSILASSPRPLFFVAVRSFKVLRLLKLNRQYRLSKVLWRTAKRVYGRIVAMTILLAFLVALFSIILYYVERGDVCFVGDASGNFGDNNADDDGNTELCAEAGLTVEAGYRRGLKFMIAKNGAVSQFENVFTAIWFSFVTLTTTGYGDIVPVTTAGKFLALCLMMCGSFYMVMPLTAAASTFSMVHDDYNEYQNRADSSKNNGNNDATAAGNQTGAGAIGSGGDVVVARVSMQDKRLSLSLKHRIASLSASLSSLTTLIQTLADGEEDEKNSKRRKGEVAKLCGGVEDILRNSERDVTDLLKYMKKHEEPQQ